MFDLSRPRYRRRSALAAALALAMVMAITACEPAQPENPPYWLPGTTVDATVHGPLVHITWDAPERGDPVSAYQINLGSYSGTVVALVPASVRSCYISGLAASTSYTIVVTARDAQMHWSGPLPGTQGNRTTTITTTDHGNAGPNLWCHPAIDADEDGLPDGVETNDGSYAGAGDTGTNPDVADTDNDGIPDGEEALGTGGINLRAMGARPTHKDLLIETDWASTPTCPTGYRPTAAAVSELTVAFADAPVANPDGTSGINLVVDYGQGGPFTGGNAITTDGSPLHSPNAPEFDAFKLAHFDPARLGIFHYGIMINGTKVAEIYGNDFLSGFCSGSAHDLAGSIMHEVGHNLGLVHGDKGDGAASVIGVANNFPNYNSVMNYAYPDVDTDCDGLGDGVLDYSRGLNAPLDESDLDETIGICNGVDIDWDHDGVIETSVQADINDDGAINFPHFRGGGFNVLHDHDDWGLIETVGLTHVNDSD